MQHRNGTTKGRLFATLLLAHAILLVAQDNIEDTEGDISDDNGSFLDVLESDDEAFDKALRGPNPIGIMDAGVTDATVNQLIAQRIYSEDPDAVNFALGEISIYTTATKNSIRWKLIPPVRRNIHDVPGLRDFLVWRWRKGVEEVGGQVPPWRTDIDENDNWILPPNWLTIPQIIAVLFPGDSAAHEIIWESHDPSQPITTIALLDAGDFRTPKAISYRIEILFAKDGDDLFAMIDAADAARSLGMCRTERGLQALVQMIDQEVSDLGLASALVESIVAYGLEAIPHRGRLGEIAEHFGVFVKDEAIEPFPHPLTFHTPDAQRYRIRVALRILDDLIAFRKREGVD